MKICTITRSSLMAPLACDTIKPIIMDLVGQCCVNDESSRIVGCIVPPPSCLGLGHCSVMDNST